MIVIADVEADGLDPTVIHCVCLETEHGEKQSFTDMSKFEEWVGKAGKITWVFHNGLSYDVPKAINKLTKVHIDTKDVIDTFVVSKLMNYSKFVTHSLKELGIFLGVHKGDYTGGWEVCTPTMVEYCEQDVEVTKAVFNYYKKDIYNPEYREALRTEHDFACVCYQMEQDGFPFDKASATTLLSEVKEEMNVLEDAFRSLLDDKRVEDRRIKLRYKADGELYASCVKVLANEEDFEIDEDSEEIIVYTRSEFNPGSPKQRIDVLWDYGWKPVEKTKGHTKFLREQRRR